MGEAEPVWVTEEAVYALTERGDAELRESETSLPREAIELLVLIDGKSSAAQLMRAAPGMTPDAARAVLAELLANGFIRPAKSGDALAFIDPGDFFHVTSPRALPAGRPPSSPEVAKGMSSLKEAGYYVRIARRAAAPPQRAAGVRPCVIVVDDDADLCKLLKTFLKIEGFEVVTASDRAEVVTAFRRPSAPDLVLLDVRLPDVDGFDVLSRMRQHRLLKAVPVIMLTAAATRGAVLKGIHYGADGYVTKPFQIDAVMKAVRSVLGAAEAAPTQM